MSPRSLEKTALPALVVGAGPVGLYAAFQLGMRGVRPVIVESLSFAGGQLAALYPEGVIEDAPGAEPVSAGALAARLEAQLAPFRPLRLYGRRATALWGGLEGGFNLETETGETITGAAVIFAGGAGAMRPKRLVAEGVAAVSADAIRYDGAVASQARAVAVVGEGPAAIDAALATAPGARRVTLIHALPLRANEERAARLAAAAGAGLDIFQGAVERLRGEGGRLEAVEARGEAGSRAFDADLLLVEAGLEYAGRGLTGLTPVADAATGETEVPGVFAIGGGREVVGGAGYLAAGFAGALRAAEAAAARLAPPAPRALARRFEIA